MKILVTGGAGFIGSNFVYYMLEAHPDYDILCVDLLTYAGNMETLAEAMKNPRFSFVRADIADAAAMDGLFQREQPDVVVCTGVLAMIPLCMEAKLSGRKLIYIESFAKVTSATLTGKLLYHYADRFYVQWTQMKEIYPDAICLGGIY